MHDNDIKLRTPKTFGLPSADVDFLAALQKFTETDAERRSRIVRDWLSIRIDGVHQCLTDPECWCLLEFEGGTSKVEIVGRDAEGEVVIATYLPTYDGPKIEVWKVSLPWGDELSCTFVYDDEECVWVEAKRIVKPELCEKHAQLTGEPEPGFFAFDRAYVERLRNGDLATDRHFASYFGRFLRIRFRARRLPPDVIDDLVQDTLLRVMIKVHKGEVRQPERFGAFVNSICNNVSLEYCRRVGQNQQMVETRQVIPEMAPEMTLDLEGMVASKWSSERMRKILSGLPPRDRNLLRAVFLEEKDQDAVCSEFGVDRDYLRVLLLRAKQKFKSLPEALT